MGLLAGLAACFLGIGVLSGAEYFVLGKVPSIWASSPPPQKDAPEEHTTIPKKEPSPSIPYYSDIDGDLIGDTIGGEAGQFSPANYIRGSQPHGWVESGGDNCIYVPNPDQRDSDRDNLGDACEEIMPKPIKDPKSKYKAHRHCYH
jgi:hypothetical protein